MTPKQAELARQRRRVARAYADRHMGFPVDDFIRDSTAWRQLYRCYLAGASYGKRHA